MTVGCVTTSQNKLESGGSDAIEILSPMFTLFIGGCHIVVLIEYLTADIHPVGRYVLGHVRVPVGRNQRPRTELVARPS